MKVRLTLPWSALASSRERNQRRGGKAHSWTYKRSMEAVRALAMGQVRGKRPRYPDVPLSVTLDFYPPDLRRRDMANYLKGLMDALQGVVYTDDYQITRMGWTRDEPDRKNPRVELLIEPIEEAA